MLFYYIFSDYFKLKSVKCKVVTLFILLILAYVLCYLFPNLSENFITSLIASFSIIVGFLFNLMVMLSNMVKEIFVTTAEPKSRIEYKKLKLNVIKKGLSIISYSVIIALFSLIMVLLYSGDTSKYYKIVDVYHLNVLNFKYLFIFLIYFMILNFIFSIFEILKITHILLQKEIDNKNKELRMF